GRAHGGKAESTGTDLRGSPPVEGKLGGETSGVTCALRFFCHVLVDSSDRETHEDEVGERVCRRVGAYQRQPIGPAIMGFTVAAQYDGVGVHLPPLAEPVPQVYQQRFRSWIRSQIIAGLAFREAEIQLPGVLGQRSRQRAGTSREACGQKRKGRWQCGAAELRSEREVRAQEAR